MARKPSGEAARAMLCPGISAFTADIVAVP
jgi:hypothetical protein